MTQCEPIQSDVYDQYSYCESKYKAEIINDIQRTPIPEWDNNAETKAKLVDILMRYSCFNTTVGYVQGMNYLVTILFLFYKNEKETFSAIHCLMTSYCVEELYQTGFHKLKQIFSLLDKTIENKFPDISNHFDKTWVTPELFTTQWIMTLFTAELLLRYEKKEGVNRDSVCWNNRDTIPFPIGPTPLNFNSLMVTLELFMLQKWSLFENIMCRILESTKLYFIGKDTETTIRVIKSYTSRWGIDNIVKSLSWTSTSFDWTKNLFYEDSSGKENFWNSTRKTVKVHK